MQCAGRAGEDGLGDLLGSCCVDDHPWAGIRIEDLRQVANASIASFA